MRRFRKAAALLALGLLTAAFARPPRPVAPQPLQPVDVHEFSARNRQEAAELLDHPETCDACRPLSGVFGVGYEMHFGYHLSVDPNFDSFIWPVFGPGANDTFNAAFSQDALAQAVGKRIYCECSGRVLDHNGMIYFKIDQARLFTK